jgi:hypothetical protein
MVLNYTGILPTSQPTLAPSSGSFDYSTAMVAAILILMVVIAFGLFRENRQFCCSALPCCGSDDSKSTLSKRRGYGSILGVMLSRKRRANDDDDGSDDTGFASLTDELAALGVAKAYVIQREDLLLDARPFAQGAGGQVCGLNIADPSLKEPRVLSFSPTLLSFWFLSMLA